MHRQIGTCVLARLNECSMIDQEADSEEEGRSLPLPSNIDAQSDQRSNAASQECEADGGVEGPDASASSVNGEQSELFFGGPDVELGLEAESGGEMIECDLQPDSAEGDHVIDSHEESRTSFSEVDQDLLDSFDEMVSQSMLSANLNDNLSLPWEDGIFKSIFSDEALVPMPEVPKVNQQGSTFESRERPGSHEAGTDAKRCKTSRTGNCLFERVISFSNTLTDHDLETARWNRALEKLYVLFTMGPDSCPKEVRLSPHDMEGNMMRLRVVCGSRSPNTINKRADSLLKFCKWYKNHQRVASCPPYCQWSCRLCVGEASRQCAIHTAGKFS